MCFLFFTCKARNGLFQKKILTSLVEDNNGKFQGHSKFDWKSRGIVSKKIGILNRGSTIFFLEKPNDVLTSFKNASFFKLKINLFFPNINTRKHFNDDKPEISSIWLSQRSRNISFRSMFMCWMRVIKLCCRFSKRKLSSPSSKGQTHSFRLYMQNINRNQKV